MSLLIRDYFSSKLFSYSDKCFFAEMSDLGPNFIRRIWDDACDEGFIIKSEWTQKQEIFILKHHQYNEEGELLYVVLVPYCEVLRRRGLTCKLFND